MAITLTETAAGEIKRYMETQKVDAASVLRVGVAGGGCSGLQYTLGFETDFNPAIDASYPQYGVHLVAAREDGDAPGRHDDRLSGRADGARILDRESECAARRRLPRLRTALARRATRAAACGFAPMRRMIGDGVAS